MRTNSEYKEDALDALRGNWYSGILAAAIYVIVIWLILGSGYVPALMGSNLGVDAVCSGTGLLLTIFILGPLSIGYVNAFRVLCDTGNPNVVSNMIYLSTRRYLQLVWVYLWRTIKIILWSFLFIIPGVIKAFSYSMTPFIVLEHPEMSADEAMAESSRIMRGHKMELFMLYLSFFGWFLLCLITAGVGIIVLEPYVECSVVGFYKDIKG